MRSTVDIQFLYVDHRLSLSLRFLPKGSQARETRLMLSRMTNPKKKRAQLRSKIARSINRIKKFINLGADARKRTEKEILNNYTRTLS